jgi:formamidopyrimidine-DNA glycosylase
MTGKFFIEDSNNKKQKTSFYYSIKKNDSKHDHISLYFNKGFKLIYNDVRKFGFLKILKSENIYKCKHLKFLGPEPLTKKFNLNYMKKYLLNKKTNIKNLLMNQKFVAGLGNIYCNEILFLSKINPHRIAGNIKKKELNEIIKNTKKILKKSIFRGGSSIKNFSNAEGKNGNFQQKFNVYNRELYKCNRKKCLGIIQKILTSNRSSFFCPSCQK